MELVLEAMKRLLSNKGISKITNNVENYFETQRLIASSDNESQYLG